MDESVFSQDRCQYLFFCNAQCFLINASPDRNTKGAGAQKYLNVNYYYTSSHLSPYVTKEQLIFSPHSLLHLLPSKTPKQYTTSPPPKKGGVREQDLLRLLETSQKIFNWTHLDNSLYSRLIMLVYAIWPSKWKEKLSAHVEKLKCLLLLSKTLKNLHFFFSTLRTLILLTAKTQHIFCYS